MSDDLVEAQMSMEVFDAMTRNNLDLKLMTGWKVAHCVPYGTQSGVLVILGKLIQKSEMDKCAEIARKRDIALAEADRDARNAAESATAEPTRGGIPHSDGSRFSDGSGYAQPSKPTE